MAKGRNTERRKLEKDNFDFDLIFSSFSHDNIFFLRSFFSLVPTQSVCEKKKKNSTKLIFNSLLASSFYRARTNSQIHLSAFEIGNWIELLRVSWLSASSHPYPTIKFQFSAGDKEKFRWRRRKVNLKKANRCHGGSAAMFVNFNRHPLDSIFLIFLTLKERNKRRSSFHS